jgi:hypothetical protein
MLEKTPLDPQNSSTNLPDSPPTTSYTVTSPSTTSQWLAPVIGVLLLLLFAGAGYAGYGYLKEKIMTVQKVVETADTEEPEYHTTMRGEIPSSCGYSLGWPDTIVESDAPKQWTYEEMPISADAFYGFGPTSINKNGALMATMFFKTNAEKYSAKDESFAFKWPGIVSYCTPNTANWTLEQFVESAKKASNDQQTITTSAEPENWGEVKVQLLNMTGISDGQYVNQPLYLAVIPSDSKFSRLVIFQPWGASDNRLSTDLTAMEASLKNRTLTEQLSVNKTAPAQNSAGTGTGIKTSNCTDFVIREGIFASDKCYSSKDLADLQYYLQRYNSAVFDQNAAASGSKITCNGSEFFKDECEEDKKQYDQALKDQEQYKSTIQGIIAKGK